MTACPSAAPVSPVSDAQELIAAAQAVFGVLELIAETPCTHETHQHVLGATHAASARLLELGVAREDLLDPARHHGRARPASGNQCARPGPVIDIATRQPAPPA
jgi:hypothetical protein